MHSCIYEGIVTHRRCQSVHHQFQYRLFMAYLDLEELPQLVGQVRPIAATQFSPRSFLRRDHLYNPSLPLAEELRAKVHKHTDRTPLGPIHFTLLTGWLSFNIFR